MRAALSRLFLAVALGLIASLLAAPASAQNCASPIKPGRWVGSISVGRDITITSPIDQKIQMVHGGQIILTVACDGRITGTIGPARLQARYATAENGRVVDYAECHFFFTGRVTGGRVEPGPVVRVNADIFPEAPSCDGQAGPLTPIFAGQLPPTEEVIRLTATTVSDNELSGTAAWAPSGLIRTWTNAIDVNGAVADQWEWTLAFRPTKSQPPLLANLAGEFERIFIAGIPLANPYTAAVDWRGGDPGTVSATLDGTTIPVELSSGATIATATVAVDTLPPGTHPIALTAASAAGEASVATEFIVAALPNWAEPLALAVDEAAPPAAIYRGRASVQIPAALGFSVPEAVPVLGGPFSLLLTAFDVPLAASSSGDVTSAVGITGPVGLVIGGAPVPDLIVSPASATRARLSETELLLVDGGIEFLPAILPATVPLVRILPGVVGLDPALPVEIRYDITPTGKIELGTDDSGLRIVGGSVVLEVLANFPVAPILDSLGRQFLLVGTAHARVEIAFDPAPRLANCLITGTASLVPLGPMDPLAPPVLAPPTGGGLGFCP